MLASAAGHGEVVKALLEAGADRGLRNKRRQTAVDIATVTGQSAVVELLK
jgi:ankyrin repeat protein